MAPFMKTATAALAAGIIFVFAATAATLRHEVGALLQEATALTNSGDYTGAMAKISAAESVTNLTADENEVIHQMKSYVAAKSGGAVGTDTAAGAQSKFSTDYRAGRYADTIEDAELLKKQGVYSLTAHVVVAQAYFLLDRHEDAKRQAEETIAFARAIGQIAPPSMVELANSRGYRLATPTSSTAKANEGMNTPSDIFQTLCVETRADYERIEQLIHSKGWVPANLQRLPNMTAQLAWKVQLQDSTVAVLAAKGMDVDIGRRVTLCMVNFTGNVEPGFVANVIAKSGLTRVPQSAWIRKRPLDAVILSDTGREANSFIVTPVEVNLFGVKSVSAFATNPTP